MDEKSFIDAHSYAANHKMVSEIVAKATSLFFPLEEFCNDKEQDGTCTMLDLGCGTCENTKWFASKIGANHIVGIDWNYNFLNFATDQEVKDNTKLVLYQVNLSQPDWQNDLPTMKYNLITSFLALHWVQNLRSCLENLKCIMTPGKTLMFHVIGIRPSQHFQASIKVLANTKKWGPLIRAFTSSSKWQDPSASDWRVAADPAAAFRDILTACGFSVSLCTKMAFAYTTESEGECRGHLKWLLPFMAELSPADQRLLIDHFMAVYGQSVQMQGPGMYVWENEVLVVLARRRLDPSDGAGAE